MTLRGLVFSLLVFVFGAAGFASARQPDSQVTHYQCRHPLLGTLATVELAVKPLPGQRLQIELSGQASGVAALVDGHRLQRYTSIVQLNGQQCPVTVSHQRLTDIDYDQRRIQYGWLLTFSELNKVIMERLWGGQVVERRSAQVDSPFLGDFLSVLLAFQQHDQPLMVSQRFDYACFSLNGMDRMTVDVEEVEPGSPETSQTLWRCRITSALGCLPGHCDSLLLWCDDSRQIVKARVPFWWGLGSLNIVRSVEADD
nr:hypothetical protein [uncultured Desulfuromonas sp.]